MESILENKLMTLYKKELVEFLKSNPGHFKETFQLAVADKQPYSWRAAFLLFDCIEENDKRITGHVKEIIDGIRSKKEGHQRELLKILYKIKLNKKYEGKVFNLCMDLWEQITAQPSVRVTAFKFIIRTAKKYPELSEEIAFFTQERYLESLSPGVKKSIKKMMLELKPG
jgi:hypothetical protein